MSVSVKQIRAFTTVARCRSFAEAADQLHLSQPALSIAIKSLEEFVGGQLLARTTRSFALTPEGEHFLPIAIRLITLWDDSLADLQDRFALQSGRITLASMPSFAANLLPKALQDFKKQHSKISITLHDVIAEETVNMVRTERVEIGVSFYPGKEPDLAFIPLFEDRFIAVLPQGHKDLTLDAIPIATLLKNDLITLQRPSKVTQMIVDRLQSKNLKLEPALETHQLATIGRMVASGLGVSIVPALCAQQMTELGAQCMPISGVEITETVGIITRRRHPLSAAALAMQEVLIKSFKTEN